MVLYCSSLTMTNMVLLLVNLLFLPFPLLSRSTNLRDNERVTSTLHSVGLSTGHVAEQESRQVSIFLRRFSVHVTSVHDADQVFQRSRRSGRRFCSESSRSFEHLLSYRSLFFAQNRFFPAGEKVSQDRVQVDLRHLSAQKQPASERRASADDASPGRFRRPPVWRGR